MEGIIKRENIQVAILAVPEKAAQEIATRLCNNSPLSKAIIAVMALYYAVGQWNSYFNAMIFLQDETLYPLQLVLKEILIASESTVGGSGETILQQYRLANQLKYVSVIVSSLPVLMLYPFVQKYFAQGVMIGSLKE